MRACANQEAHAWLLVATEEVARLACASGAFARGPNVKWTKSVTGIVLGLSRL